MKEAALAAGRFFRRLAAFFGSMADLGAPVAPGFRLELPGTPGVPVKLVVVGRHFLLKAAGYEFRSQDGGVELAITPPSEGGDPGEAAAALERAAASLEPALRGLEGWAPALAPVLGELDHRARALLAELREMRSPAQEQRGEGYTLAFNPARGGGVVFTTPRVRVAVGPGVGGAGARLAGLLDPAAAWAAAQGIDLRLFEEAARSFPAGLIKA